MPDVVRENANQILKNMIREKGLKQYYLAKKIGISPQSMSALLHGDLKFTADIAIRLGKALNEPYEVFLNKSYSKREE